MPYQSNVDLVIKAEKSIFKFASQWNSRLSFSLAWVAPEAEIRFEVGEHGPVFRHFNTIDTIFLSGRSASK